MISASLIAIAIILRIILLIILSISLKSIIQSYKGYHQRSVFILVIFILIAILFTIFSLVFIGIKDYTWSSNLNGIMGIVVGFFIILFLEAYESASANPQKIAIATFLATTSLYLLLVLSAGKFDLILEIVSFGEVGFFIIPLYFFFILITSQLSINRLKKYASNYQRKKMNGLLGFVYATFGGITLLNTLGPNILFKQFDFNNPIQFMYYLFGSHILFIFAYLWFHIVLLKDNNPGIFQPQQIDKIIIISQSGIPIYTKDVDIEVEHLDDALLTGALTAINSVLKEATQVSDDLKLIQLGSQNLMINSTKDFTLVIFTYNVTQYLQEALDAITKKLVNYLNEESFIEQISVTTADNIDELIFQYLGV